MDKVREFLGRRVMGVPVVAFVAIGMAVLLFFALRMKSTATATTEDAAPDEPGGDADPFGGDATNPTFQASPGSSTVIAVPTADTNELWAKRAREWLSTTSNATGKGPTSALAAQQVISKYMNSEPLTAIEKAAINRCIAQFGYPPEPPEIVDAETVTGTEDDTVTSSDEPEPTVDPVPTGGGGSGSTPPTKQGTPPCMHTVLNARDNGPGELGILYFGNNNPATVNKIEAANTDKGPGPWQPGTRIKIPENVTPAYFTCTAAVRGLNEIAAKNGVTKEYIKALNPGVEFPRPVGSKVRVR